jgi:hypothetical protein
MSVMITAVSLRLSYLIFPQVLGLVALLTATPERDSGDALLSRGAVVGHGQPDDLPGRGGHSDLGRLESGHADAHAGRGSRHDD